MFISPLFSQILGFQLDRIKINLHSQEPSKISFIQELNNVNLFIELLKSVLCGLFKLFWLNVVN